MAKVAQIRAIVEQLKRYDYHYYVLDDPLVSDFEYDQLYKQLQALEQAHPELIQPDSPTQRVGGIVVEAFNKFPHQNPMLSLDNAFDTATIASFIANINNLTGVQNRFVVEPKIDGVSISLTYENGLLTRALTRGDGLVGEDVLSNVKTIKSIPLTIPFHKQVEIRGEIFVDKKTFAQINENLAKPFANARNLAAGTLRNLNSEVSAKRKLKAFFYFVPNALTLGCRSQSAVLAQLKQWNFPVSKAVASFDRPEALIEYLEQFDQTRDQLNFQVDGLVVKLDNFHFYDQLGFTSKFPRWALAYKFKPKFVQTKLRGVLVTVGRTGKINYTAQLDPVNLEGTVVSAATLHNFDYIKEKDIRLNDTVIIYKAGEIIPKVLEVCLPLRTAANQPIPERTHCPACQAPLVQYKDEVDQYCTNERCDQRNLEAINYFVSKTAMDIQGLSIQTISKLYENNLVRSVVDLYHLKEHKAAVLALELKIGEVLFNKLISSIEQSKTKGMARLLTGLGIKHVGQVLAKSLTKHFENIDALQSASMETLLELPDVGPTVAESLFNWFHNDNNLQLLAALKAVGVQMDALKSNTNFDTASIYFQKSFVITGSFPISRDTIKNLLVNKYDCRFTNNVTSKVDFVLAGIKATPRKLEQAKALNIPIINEPIWT
ncbi:NAD-dependent DNA ligase LigA [Mycoplasmoides pneumoniae]